MSDFRKSFEEDLEKLIQLFKRIKVKSANQLFTDFDKTLVQNLDFMIKNYETFKNNIPAEFINQMGEPFQQMLKQMIEQLEEELGDDFLINPAPEFTKPVEKIAQTNVQLDVSPTIDDQISSIDQLLKNRALSEDEVNALLDKRLKLNQLKN